MYFLAEPPPESSIDQPLDTRVRLASDSDLEELFALYERFELDPFPTRVRVRRYLKEAFRRGPVVVATENGRIVGAIRVDARSPRYLLWGGLTVHPEYRRRGIGNDLVAACRAVTKVMGLGVCGVRAATNPMSFRQFRSGIESGAITGGIWAEIPLRPPIRFRGQGKLRKAIERLEGHPRRPPPDTPPRPIL